MISNIKNYHESVPAISYLARQEGKPREFTERGLVTSECRIIDQIPNPDELAQLEGHFDAISVRLDGGDAVVAVEEEPYDFDIDLEKALSVIGAMLPIVAKDFRECMGLQSDATLVATLSGSIGLVDGPVAPRDELYRPHLDGDESDPAGSNFYIATVGAPTKVWESVFDVSENAQGAGELWLEQVELLEGQIHEKRVEPAFIEPGSIISLDSQTVHASPDAGSEAIGTRRAFVAIHLKVAADA